MQIMSTSKFMVLKLINIHEDLLNFFKIFYFTKKNCIFQVNFNIFFYSNLIKI